MKGRCFEMSLWAQSLKYWLRRPWSPPSKEPFAAAKEVNEAKVCWEGLKTKTPELKQSGQPTSGAAESSSRSNNSSQFFITFKNIYWRMREKKYSFIFSIKWHNRIWWRDTNQSVSVDEYAFFILSEPPTMKLGECDSELGSGQKG